jgi:hypothetical protein
VSIGAGGAAWSGHADPVGVAPLGCAWCGLLVADDTPDVVNRAAMISTNSETARVGTDLLTMQRTRAE